MSKSPTQADIEALALLHEAAGNQPCAFTLRTVGTVGTVLEEQGAIIARHREAGFREGLEMAAKVAEGWPPYTETTTVTPASWPIDDDDIGTPEMTRITRRFTKPAEIAEGLRALAGKQP